MVIVEHGGQLQVVLNPYSLFGIRERERNPSDQACTRAMKMPMTKTDLAELEHGRPGVEAIGATGVPARLWKPFENIVVISSTDWLTRTHI